MKIVMIRNGQIAVDEIPVPQADNGKVLVKVVYSCISAGTELSGVQNSANPPLWKRALQNPEKTLETLKKASTKGVSFARNFVETKLAGIEAGRPTGYSAAGIVQAVGADITDLQVGQRVACAGSRYAFHAEYIAVPRNLIVPIDDALDFAQASTVALGAIALQGLRRANPTLGETFVVIGLGILGQLTVQMLKANGCHVIGVELDRARIALAKSLGMDAGIHPNDDDALEITARLTNGNGADGVIITAATPSDAVIATAFRMCRRKGRVVLVGDVGLHLNRADFYEKEIDFLISTSYGPGRYDRRYEEDGLDYPIGYVRWTENRNMAEYLRMLSDRRLNIVPLINATFKIDDSPAAFAAFSRQQRPLIVLLQYSPDTPITHTVLNPKARAPLNGQIKLLLVGAGNFATQTHLPNLRLLKDDYYLHTVVTRSGEKAALIARQYGFKQASTDFASAVADPAIDAVLIATRHHQHAAMLFESLRHGKHVFVEKPTVVNADEWQQLQAYAQTHAYNSVILTGYNRRFSPHIQYIAQRLSQRREPLIINYRMNAGYLSPEHWAHGVEGGGRNIGEACHIYDLFVMLTQSHAVDIHAAAIRPAHEYYSHRDNFVATIRFEDGSICSLTYTATGYSTYPRESMEIFCEGQTLTMRDYQVTQVYAAKPSVFRTPAQEKGHKEILEAFARAVHDGQPSPILLSQQLEVMRIALAVDAFLQK